MNKENRLVSIIVRTKDRPELFKRALQSVAAQTYRPTEVVLVNDGGCDLDIEEIKAILGDVSLNYIRLEENTGRAHAGNVGIENAKGEYIGFLDDDDEFYPEHIETLITFLEQSDYKIVYTDTEMVYKEFSPEGGKVVDINKFIFSKDFSYNDLLVGNYIPFNSVCFSKDVLKSVASFDEDFDLYEDWDFLIRVGQRYPFYHIKKITARYNQWSKESQINQADTEYMKAMHLRVMDKHREKITPAIILNIKNEKERLEFELKDLTYRYNALREEIKGRYILVSQYKHNELEEAIRGRNIRISQLEDTIRERDNRISQLEDYILQLQETINVMRNTLGWQMIESFRRLREKILPIGTKYRKIYDLGIKSIKYIRREGFRRFINRVFHRYNIPASFTRNNYEIWISKNEPDYASLKKQVKLSKEFKLSPKISIITPVYNPEKRVFIEMIESVINQTYDNWELCIADASSKSYVRNIIENYAKNNFEKIKIKYLDKNYGIANNSNEALSLATGDFIALLDHDDELAPFAFFEVVKTINENTDVDFIYSDRDKLYNNKRFDPFFKPDWSPDYLLSQNYLCHLNIIRKTLIDKVQGFREGYDGSQDYDLVLRITELTNNIIHIPKILYHWRVVEGSAAGNPEESKPYAFDAAIRALQDAINRRGWKGTVSQGKVKGLYRVIFELNRNPWVSIIIPTKDKSEILRRCVDSILNKTTYKNYEIVIVDNQSIEEKTFKYYKELTENHKTKLLIYDKPFNFSAINNYAVSKLDTGYVLFLNNDTEVMTENWIELMLGFAQRKETGAVGGKLIYPDGTIQTAGLILDEKGNVRRSHWKYPKNSLGYAGRMQSVQNFSAIAAACMMVRREVFDEVEGFDPQFVIAHGDIDFCLKLRERNYLIVYEPHVEIYHHESLTRGYEDIPEKIERLQRETFLLLQKRGHMLEKGDPYFNPNLTAEKEDFSIRL